MTGVCLAIAMGCAGAIELRGGRVIDPPIERIGIEGVVVGGDEARTIGWDAVKDVTGEFAEEAEAYLGIAEDAWRARLRLARGDVRLAEPLLETLWVEYQDKVGPTALMVAEGMVVVRTARAEQSAAVSPWLRAVEMRHAGEKLAGDPTPRPVLDSESLLCPWLAPIWLPGVRLGEVTEMRVAEVQDVPSAYRALYRGMTRRAMGMEADLPTIAQWPETPGVRMLRTMLGAQSDDAGERRTARDQLIAGLETDADTWREAWRRVVIGMSFLREEGETDRTRGIFQLLHVPSRFSRTQPYLAGAALAMVGEELDRRGDDAGAMRVLAEIREIDEQHPALAWLQDRLTKPVRESRANTR